MNQFDLLKSHIDAYTRKDGAVVGAHDDKRAKKPIAIGSKVKLKGDHWGPLNGHKGTVSGAGKKDGQFNVRGDDGQDRAFNHKDLDHDDEKPKAIQSAIDTLAPGDDNWKHGDGHSSYPMRMHGNNHMNSMDTLGDQGWAVTGGEHDEMKHPDGHTATFKDGAMTLKH